MVVDGSFKKAGTVPFKWEIRPGVPKCHGSDLLQLKYREEEEQDEGQPPSNHSRPDLHTPRMLRPPPAGRLYYQPTPAEPRLGSFRSALRTRSERYRFDLSGISQPVGGCFPSPLLKRRTAKALPEPEPDYCSDLETLPRWSASSRKSVSPFSPQSPFLSSFSSNESSSPRPVCEPFWCQISSSPSNACQCSVPVVFWVNEFGQAKVRDLGVVILVQENVLGLYITMNNAVSTFFMEVRDPPRSSQSNVISLFPIQKLTRMLRGKEESKILRRNNRIGGIIESSPNIRNGVVSENEITGIVEAGEGYAAAGGVGGPDNGGRRSGAGGELKVAVGEEAESSGGVNGGGDPAGVPDGDFGVVGDCGEEGVGIRRDE
nr:F-box only protein 11-like [Ipomoea batatas]